MCSEMNKQNDAGILIDILQPFIREIINDPRAERKTRDVAKFLQLIFCFIQFVNDNNKFELIAVNRTLPIQLILENYFTGGQQLPLASVYCHFCNRQTPFAVRQKTVEEAHEQIRVCSCFVNHEYMCLTCFTSSIIKTILHANSLPLLSQDTSLLIGCSYCTKKDEENQLNDIKHITPILTSWWSQRQQGTTNQVETDFNTFLQSDHNFSFDLSGPLPNLVMSTPSRSEQIYPAIQYPPPTPPPPTAQSDLQELMLARISNLEILLHRLNSSNNNESSTQPTEQSKKRPRSDESDSSDSEGSDSSDEESHASQRRKVRPKVGKYKCSFCKEIGHTRPRCQQRAHLQKK